MKKQIALFLSVALLLALCGCTARKEPTGEGDTEVVNPVHETDAAGVAERLGAAMTAPEGAENVSYRLIDGEQPIGEMTFTPAAALDNKRLPETDLMFGKMMEGELR